MASLGLRRSCAAVGSLVLGLVAGCGRSDAPDDAQAPAPPVARVLSASQALAGAEIRKLDPATLVRAEIVAALGNRPLCIFRYTSSGKPVLAAGMGAGSGPEAGVVKLNGHLVPLQPDPDARAAGGGWALVADSVRIQVRRGNANAASLPPGGGGPVEADLVFQVGDVLTVGYAGYLECGRDAAAAPRGTGS
ncbi:hypothetical protein JI739_06420 [Ramlibacter sp. AW1]|uniref:Lipoprotein n=1 Tax=Ramlibacter aurantiacus TaxID=2801330 RepID=A0A937D448_9BURK|nr:hypothetical protein [Ramlibacter aurantiacus]MBL0419977.1 hypothetical protein [Ramlibacter aurantiacus]